MSKKPHEHLPQHAFKSSSGSNEALPAQNEIRLVVNASGEQLVSGSGNFRQILLEALDQSDWIEIDCSGLKDADLTFFQILCAANYSASAKNKTVTLKGHEQPPFAELTAKLGLVRHEGGAKEICQSCIWAGGKNPCAEQL